MGHPNRNKGYSDESIVLCEGREQEPFEGKNISKRKKPLFFEILWNDINSIVVCLSSKFGVNSLMNSGVPRISVYLLFWGNFYFYNNLIVGYETF